MSLIETLVGLALTGVIVVGLLSGMSTALKAVSLSRERVSVDSLVKSQIEYIRSQDYLAAAPDGPANRYELLAIPPDLAAAGYSVDINLTRDPILSEYAEYELQEITVTVKRDGKAKLAVSIYRVSD